MRCVVQLWVSVLLIGLLASCTMPVAPAAPAAGQETPAAAAEATELTVFAAASLTEAFDEIGEDFAAENPGTTVAFNFAGSQQLAQQLGQGAPADVFASANNSQMNVAIEAGRVVSGTQRTFARNRLVVVFPSDNPAGISTLQDLAKPGLKLVLAAKEVPVGGYSLDFLNKASATPEFTATFSETVLANVVSYEENVRAVLSKVALGEADAGIVYTSDVTPDVADQVGRVDIPDALNVIASYPIVPISDSASPEMAQAFMDYVLSEPGQMVLAEHGFIPTIGTATGEAPGAVPVEITGKVATPTTYTAADLEAMETVEITAADRDGAAQTFIGVPILALLEAARIQADAATIAFAGGDGYTVEVPLADLQADPDAIIAIDENDSLRNIIPTQAPRTWVKGLVTIEVQ